MVRAKFICVAINKTAWSTEYVFNPVTTGSEENERFFQTTPAGKISVFVNHKKTGASFELDKEYYVDFQAVEREVRNE